MTGTRLLKVHNESAALMAVTSVLLLLKTALILVIVISPDF